MPVFPDFDRFFSVSEWLNGRLSAYDNKFRIIDNLDNTKRAAFQVSGLTTATERTYTLPDASDTLVGLATADTFTNKTLTSPTINTPVVRRTVVDTGGAFATPVVLTAANSGSTYLLDDAAGLDFTLPALTGTATNGIHFRFYVMTTVTSNSYRFTAQTGDIIHGHVLMSDFDAAYTAPQILAAEAGGAVLVITMAVAASGGTAGGWFELEAISGTAWFCRGNLLGDGTIVTVFS